MKEDNLFSRILTAEEIERVPYSVRTIVVLPEGTFPTYASRLRTKLRPGEAQHNMPLTAYLNSDTALRNYSGVLLFLPKEAELEEFSPQLRLMMSRPDNFRYYYTQDELLG